MSWGWRWSVSADWTSTIQAEPLIDALRMKAMFALWYTSQRLFAAVLRQAYRASGVIWSW